MLQLEPYKPEWPALLQGAIVMSKPRLQLRPISGFKALLHPRSLLMSMASDSTEGHADVSSLGRYLSLCCCLWAMLPLEPC